MSWAATIDPAVEIAAEHCRWARAYGLRPYEVGLSIERLDVRNWDEAVWAVAAAYDGRFGNPCLHPACGANWITERITDLAVGTSGTQGGQRATVGMANIAQPGSVSLGG